MFEKEIIDSLTPSELAVLKAVGEGKSNREIADSLFISYHTVRAHLKSIYEKLGMRRRADVNARVSLALYANGLIKKRNRKEAQGCP